jgi:16S rRNA (cytosine967-C5)-methyltransferase
MTETQCTQSAPAGLAARRAALDILSLVRSGKPLDLALATCRSFAALSGADRGFARALAMAALRRRGSLDQVIAAFIDRPLPRRAGRVYDILRIAAAQTAILEVPAHAAVAIAVDLAKEFKETQGYAALVNAVARKIAKAGVAAIAKLPARADTPGWLWRSWERAYGPDRARAIAEMHRQEPPLDVTLKTGIDPDDLAARLCGAKTLTGSIRLARTGDVTGLCGFAEGLWWVQDAAAALPARLLGDVAGKLVLDLCAAPGGKTMQLAAAGARVIAVDSSGPRLKTVAENLRRVGQVAETTKADIFDWTPPAPADAVLLDAPCSATGTIRRNPDILWSRKEEEIGALASVQQRMIERAAMFLKPGGLLVFATCSLQPEEGEGAVDRALGAGANLARVPVSAGEIAGLAEAITGQGDLRTLPCHWADRGGMDGFFAARLRRGAGA